MSQGSDGLNFFKIKIFTHFLSIQKMENIFLHPLYLPFHFPFTSQSVFVKRKSCKLDLQRLKRKEKDWVGLDFRDSRCILR